MPSLMRFFGGGAGCESEAAANTLRRVESAAKDEAVLIKKDLLFIDYWPCMR